MGRFAGLLCLLLLVANIYAIIHVANSGRSILERTLWGAGIIAFPLVGVLAWAVFGPRARS